MTPPVLTETRRLALLAATSFLIPLVLVVLAYGVVERYAAAEELAKEMTPERIAERIKPFATIQVAGAPPVPAQANAPQPQETVQGPAAIHSASAAQTAAVTPRSGEAVYSGTCIACHGAGVAGAPKFGDHAAWQPRAQQGLPALVDHAIHGKGAMPPKGGNATLTEEEIRSAIQYMLKAAGD